MITVRQNHRKEGVKHHLVRVKPQRVITIKITRNAKDHESCHARGRPLPSNINLLGVDRGPRGRVVLIVPGTGGQRPGLQRYYDFSRCHRCLEGMDWPRTADRQDQRQDDPMP